MLESRISVGAAEKLSSTWNSDANISSWFYDLEGHANKCVERYCELENKTTQQLYKVATPCIDDHHFKEEKMGSVGALSKVYSQIVLKCLYLASIGWPDTLPPETYAVIFVWEGGRSNWLLLFQFLAPVELFFKQLKGCSFWPGRNFFYLQFCARGLPRPHFVIRRIFFQPLWNVKGLERYTSWKVRVSDYVFREKYVHIQTHTYIFKYMYIYMCVYVCTYLYKYMYIYMCMYVCVFFFFFCCVLPCHVVCRASLIGWLSGWVWCGVVCCCRHVVVVVVLVLGPSCFVWWENCNGQKRSVQWLNVKLDSAWNVLSSLHSQNG